MNRNRRSDATSDPVASSFVVQCRIDRREDRNHVGVVVPSCRGIQDNRERSLRFASKPRCGC